MKTIKDAVHDHIEIEPPLIDLIDTPEMQRLRHIRQLGTAYLVYPSANHTRFEHSLGVYHLAKRALDSLGIEGTQRNEVLAASLLHDIGHSPFSHNIEVVIEEYTGKRHDDVEDIIQGEIADFLEENDLSPGKVIELIKGDGKLGQLVSGVLDVDRMDYLVRDAHHTGVPYGTIDSERLVLELEFIDDELVLGEGNIQTAEALLIARALMHPTVYNHHVARISKALLRKATRKLIENGVPPSEIRRMDDHEFIVKLRNTDETRDIGERISKRNLYKRALYEASNNVVENIYELDESELESEIAERAGLPNDEVIIDTQPPPEMVEGGARVVFNGSIERLENVSSLVESLKETRKDQWKLGVYTPEEVVGDVAEAASDLLLK